MKYWQHETQMFLHQQKNQIYERNTPRRGNRPLPHSFSRACPVYIMSYAHCDVGSHQHSRLKGNPTPRRHADLVVQFLCSRNVLVAHKCEWVDWISAELFSGHLPPKWYLVGQKGTKGMREKKNIEEKHVCAWWKWRLLSGGSFGLIPLFLTGIL